MFGTVAIKTFNSLKVLVVLISSTIMILAVAGLIGWVAGCLFPCDIVFESGGICPVASVSTQQPLIREQQLSGLHL